MSKIEVQYAVVDAGDVMVSHDAKARSWKAMTRLRRPASCAVAGNGRAAGIKLAWERGTAGGYKAGLIEDVDLLGIDPAVSRSLSRGAYLGPFAIPPTVRNGTRTGPRGGTALFVR
jgi:hypothetical protein